MTFKKSLPQLILVTVFTLLVALIVRAGFADSVDVVNMDSYAFPRIVAELDGEDLDEFSVKNIQLTEAGEMNHGPMVYLPPAPSTKVVDLFVILDHGGNTTLYSQALQVNLKALVQTMEEDGVDVKVYVTTFDSPDSPMDQAPTELEEATALVEYLNNLGLNGNDLSYAFGLNKLYHFSTLNARPNAEKVALVLNGTPFYTHEANPNDTTYTVSDTVNQLVNSNFIIFVSGAPFKALHALKTEQVEDVSLSHAMAGGYLGSLATDLPIIHQLLKLRWAGRGVLMYYSNLPKDQTGPVDLYLQGELVGGFSYLALNRSGSGYFTHLNVDAIEWGEPVSIAFKIHPIYQLIGLVEFYYLNSENEVERLFAEPKLLLGDEDERYYQVELDAYDHPEEYFRYNVIAHTPFGPIGSMSDLVSLPVALYDEGIILQSTLLNDSILWQWSGPTVDQGTSYEIWVGDEKIDEILAQQLEIPVTDCFRYQVVQVRVKINGEWSHFSAPGEAYLGPQGQITEQEGIERMLECVDDTPLNSANQVVQGVDFYKPNNPLYLEKTLYYLTRVAHPETADNLELGRYRLLYFVLGWITEAQHDDYDSAIDKIPQSLLYKGITQVNHIQDLEADMAWGMHELLIRLQGHPSI